MLGMPDSEKAATYHQFIVFLFRESTSRFVDELHLKFVSRMGQHP